MIIYPNRRDLGIVMIGQNARMYPKWYGFGAVAGYLEGLFSGADGKCPQYTKLVAGRGCCLPAELHFKNKLTCCNRYRDIKVNKTTSVPGKYSLECNDANTVPVDGNGGGGTRRRDTGFSDSGGSTTDSTSGSGSTLLLLGGAGVLLYLITRKKKPAATAATGATK